jgi:hypothetical protein
MKLITGRGNGAIFTVASRIPDLGTDPDSARQVSSNPCLTRVPQENVFRHCTKTCHRLVDGVHSIENTCTYNRVFFIDEKNRKSRTESFFDSF